MSQKYFLLVFCIVLFSMALFFLTPHYFKMERMEEHTNTTDIALSVNGIRTETFPLKDSNLKVSNITCNEGIGYWDYESWGLRIRNITNTRVKCNIEFASMYRDTILNGADPILKNNLVPITIEPDGTVTKANLGTKWYSYRDKVWANAVILSDESKTYYSDEVIPESNIESYFVWIPRYKYQIFNDEKNPGLTTIENKEQEIKVIFENRTTSISNGNTVNSWLTHPAFTSFDSNGMWVGKFETGYKGATTTANAQINSSDSSKLQIKPNVYSWRGIQVSNAHLSSYNYQRDLDSHMMKNTEWGSVAFLQHSKYGSQTSVRINNNSSYITGYAATREPTCGYTNTNIDCNKYESTALNADGTYTKRYNSDSGYTASTTGNISGVYDMSGAHTYTFSVMKNEEETNYYIGKNALESSGFNGLLGCPTCDNQTKREIVDGIDLPNAKYYDAYKYTLNRSDFRNLILGDATGEMGGFATYEPLNRTVSSWYKDQANFQKPDGMFFARGNYYLVGEESGIFAFSGANGSAYAHVGFRLVLTVL